MDNAIQPEQKLHFIVACMGRLEFVKQTIEAALAQPNTTYTLVDYSCPQKSGDWVREHYPAANVVYSGPRQGWNPSEARNLGAKTIQDGWYCALDSDIILHPEFSATALAMITPGKYLRAPLNFTPLYGMMVCLKTDFDRCGGYDEVMHSWGYEDLDLRTSLERSGLTPLELPASLMQHIDHDDSLRTSQCAIKEKSYTALINQLYGVMKNVLLRADERCDEPVRRRLYHYATERFLQGYPWLSWPDTENVGPVLPALFRTMASIGQSCESIASESWGGVRAFRIERAGQAALLELLTVNDSQTVTVRSPGRSGISAMTVLGEGYSIPLENGEARITLTREPVFLLDDAELVKDIQISVTPAGGPFLIVELTPGAGCTEAVEVSVKIGSQPPVSQAVALQDEVPAQVRVPVTVAAPEKPVDVTVTITGAGIHHEIMRRTTFLTAKRVSGEEAAQLMPPERLNQFIVGGRESWVDVIPNRYKGPDDLSADVAWGWTDTALVCWITRHDDVPLDGGWDGDGVQIAVQPQNARAHFAVGLQFTLFWDDARNWVVLEKALLDPGVTLDDILIGGQIDGCRRMVVQLPFEILGITLEVDHTVGLSMLFSDNDGNGRKGWLEWGGGIGLGRSPRKYNELILE